MDKRSRDAVMGRVSHKARGTEGKARASDPLSSRDAPDVSRRDVRDVSVAERIIRPTKRKRDASSDGSTKGSSERAVWQHGILEITRQLAGKSRWSKRPLPIVPFLASRCTWLQGSETCVGQLTW